MPRLAATTGRPSRWRIAFVVSTWGWAFGAFYGIVPGAVLVGLLLFVFTRLGHREDVKGALEALSVLPIMLSLVLVAFLASLLVAHFVSQAV